MSTQNKREEATTEAKERMEEVQMDWNTIYITGKPGFKKEVAKRLEGAEVAFMPGYIGSGVGGSDHDMYWLDKDADLRSFKEAITAKAIWKYRIRFYASLEAFIASQEKKTEGFTKKDIELIEEMRKSA